MHVPEGTLAMSEMDGVQVREDDSPNEGITVKRWPADFPVVQAEALWGGHGQSRGAAAGRD
jgi:hypothetical protein